MRVVNVYRQHANAVALRILNKLRGAVKPHGQAVQQAGKKRGRVVAFEPGGEPGEQGEARRVRFREAITAEALDLLEQAAREFLVVAALDHAAGELFLESEQFAVLAPVGNGAAQLVGLAAGETGCNHGQLDHLLLENGYAEGALQHVLDFIARVAHYLQALLAPQVGVHHVALYRPGPHDGDLDHQIVEAFRPQARQHGHLRARFDLEHAHRICLLQHAPGGGVVFGDIAHGFDGGAVAVHHLQRFANGREHAQGEYIHLKQAEGLDVFLIPLDHGALRHAGVLHRHQCGDGAAGDDEAAHVLRQVARKAENLLYQRIEQLGSLAVPGHALLLETFGEIGAAIPPGERLGEIIHEHGIQPQRAAHIAHGAARTVGDNGGRQRGALVGVLAVDVLDHLLAPLVLEIHVDIRRLIALPRNKALEQQRHLHRRHLGDEQAVTHHRVGGGAAALAENIALAGEAHDVVHGEKVVLVLEFADQFQLGIDTPLHLHRYARRPPGGGAGGHQRVQVTAGALALGHYLLGVFVAQLIQAEIAQAGNVQALVKQGRRVQALQGGKLTQVPLAVTQAPATELLDAGVVLQRREHVVQRFARCNMHAHIAAGHQRNGQRLRHGLQGLVAAHLVVAQQVAHAQPEAIAAQPLELQAVGARGVVVPLGQPDEQAALEMKDNIAQGGTVFTFGAAPARHADKAGELAVGRAVGHQRQQAYAFFQPQLAADNEFKAGFLRRHVGLHHARQRAFIGNSQRRVAEPGGARHQLVRVGRAAQEAVTAQAMEFGVGHVLQCGDMIILYVCTV